ncbi:MAG: TonB-dependent receptor [Acidobacteriota bacterium]
MRDKTTESRTPIPPATWKATMLVALTLGPWPASAFGDHPPPEVQTEPEPAEQRPAESGEVPRIYEVLDVRERGDDLTHIAEAASEGSTGGEQLMQRPILRSGEVVETVPGVIATQHSGGGKANQYFLRGFNLDHGTDFSVSVAGIPVNMPSHGHGQGYADLNFLIPELIDRVRFRKGPYSAEKGDFSAAGGVDIDLLRSLPEGLASVSGGDDGFRRSVIADSFSLGGGDLLAGIEIYNYDGPWTREDDFERFNGLVRYSTGDAGRGTSLTAMAYSGDWLSTDQIPRRALEQRQIDRFDLIDPGPRGSTERYSLSAAAHRGDSDSLSRVEAYALFYDFGLISQFTYFLDDPERGDQFEQSDRRWVGGIDASHTRRLRLGSRPVEGKTGLQIRFDDIENGLFRTAALERFATVREDAIRLLTGGPYAEATIRWSDSLRGTVGLRADFYRAEVESNRAINSGNADDLLVSPKAGLVFGPWGNTELYVNFGSGFHSNDARGATIRRDPVTGEPVRRVDPLVRARGAEIGLRSTRIQNLQSTVSVFLLELDSELVFVGDAGGTEASRPSRRTGIEWTNFFQPLPWISFDLDVALTEARFTDRDPTGDEIPGALEHVVAAGVTVSDRGPWFGAIRLRYLSDYPLIEDGSVRSGATALVNGRLGYAFRSGLSVALEGFNLLDREDADIAYFYPSRLPGEPAQGVDDVHFHPVEPRSARLTARWRF